MTKKEKGGNQPQNQVGEQSISQDKWWDVENITKNKVSELRRIFNRHAWPREVIEHAKYKLYPIESGIMKFFNPTKGIGFITPDDILKKDVYVTDTERTFKDWDIVEYIEINQEALVASKGIVKFKSGTGENKILFITPDDISKKDVALMLNPTYPHNKVEGNGNIADKSRPEYAINLRDFDSGDEVEFVANKKWNVVAIKKMKK